MWLEDRARVFWWTVGFGMVLAAMLLCIEKLFVAPNARLCAYGPQHCRCTGKRLLTSIIYVLVSA